LKLALNVLIIQDVQFGDRTEIIDHVLYINRLELQELLQEDQRLRKVEIELAHPGESCRILQVVDVVEPRAKIEGPSGDFPGVLSKMDSAGEGKTCVLRGTAVILNDQSEAEDLSQQTEDALGFFIDMSGPAADIHLYGQLHNIVILPYPAEDATRDGYRVAMKKASLKAAAYLAQAGKDIEPDEVEIYEAPPLAEISKGMEALPKTAYILMVHCTSYPAIPGEPVLYGERHGKELCFAGVILTTSHVTEPERERSAMMAATTAKSILGADGVILTKASSGAPDVDLAQTAQNCEDLGLKTVLIVFDRSNRQEIGEVFNMPDVSAIVCTANQYEALHLPAMERIIGNRVTLPNGIACDGELDKVFRYIRGGLDQAGITNIMPVRY